MHTYTKCDIALIKRSKIWFVFSFSAMCVFWCVAWYFISYIIKVKNLSQNVVLFQQDLYKSSSKPKALHMSHTGWWEFTVYWYDLKSGVFLYLQDAEKLMETPLSKKTKHISPSSVVHQRRLLPFSLSLSLAVSTLPVNSLRRKINCCWLPDWQNGLKMVKCIYCVRQDCVSYMNWQH